MIPNYTILGTRRKQKIVHCEQLLIIVFRPGFAGKEELCVPEVMLGTLSPHSEQFTRFFLNHLDMHASYDPTASLAHVTWLLRTGIFDFTLLIGGAGSEKEK